MTRDTNVITLAGCVMEWNVAGLSNDKAAFISIVSIPFQFVCYPSQAKIVMTAPMTFLSTNHFLLLYCFYKR